MRSAKALATDLLTVAVAQVAVSRGLPVERLVACTSTRAAILLTPVGPSPVFFFLRGALLPCADGLDNSLRAGFPCRPCRRKSAGRFGRNSISRAGNETRLPQSLRRRGVWPFRLIKDRARLQRTRARNTMSERHRRLCAVVQSFSIVNGSEAAIRDDNVVVQLRFRCYFNF